MIKQRLYGLGVLAVGIFSAVVLDGDITFALCALPLGVALITSRRRWLA